MREGGRRAKADLPDDGLIRPVGRAGIGDWYDVDADYGRRASRGVQKNA